MANLAEILASHGTVEKHEADSTTAFIKRVFALLNKAGSDCDTVYIMRQSEYSEEQQAEYNSGDEVIAGTTEVVWFTDDSTTIKSLAGRFTNRASNSESHARTTYGELTVGITLTNGESDTGLVLHRA
jgi:hypothetical protein